MMAQQHGATISEWNLGRQSEWPTALFDETLTSENPVGDYGPVPESDGSDGSDLQSAI